MSDELKKVLVLSIALPDFNADDLDELAGYCSEPDPPDANDRLFVVTEEWMRDEIGLFFTTIPGDKCMSDDFGTVAEMGRIVGAHTVDREALSGRYKAEKFAAPGSGVAPEPPKTGDET